MVAFIHGYGVGFVFGCAYVKISSVLSKILCFYGVTRSCANIAYYDIQDWQVIYYLRKNIFVIASQPRYKQAKATIQKLQALKSELLQACKDLEALEMLQYVDKFAGSFTVDRQPTNRHAAVYKIPVNVVPGFHNKGLALVGTTTFDSIIS